MVTFSLEEEAEYIELHDLLKVTGTCPSGGAAKAAIGEGRVKVDGTIELRKRCKVRRGQTVQIGDRIIVISTERDRGR